MRDALLWNEAQVPCWAPTEETGSSISEVCAYPGEISAAACGLLILWGIFGELSQVVPWGLLVWNEFSILFSQGKASSYFISV